MATVPDVLAEAESRMKRSVEAVRRELASIRTGRATPALVEHLMVDYYGAPTPLNQLAAISTPEARLLLIQPWDRQSITAIEKSVLKSDLGLTPINDGNVIRLNVPTLTEERRRDLVRLVKKRVEEGKVSVRNNRRDALDRLRTMGKEKAISQDDSKRAQEQLQRLTDAFINQMDRLQEEKEAEVLEV